MNENCRAFKEETNELVKLLSKELGKSDTFVEMSATEFELAKLMIKMTKTSGDLVGELAESIKGINQKLDELLKKNR